MEVAMSIGSLSRSPLSNSLKTHEDYGFLRASSFVSRSRGAVGVHEGKKKEKRSIMVVEAKGKKGMQSRQFQRPPPPHLPKIEGDGNPKFVIFIRTANVYLWYPLSLITGGTTAKIMVAAKDNFLGKYIYKDTIARNLAAVISRLPRQEELKTVLDKVKDFFGEAASGAKESFGKLTDLDTVGSGESEAKSEVKTW